MGVAEVVNGSLERPPSKHEHGWMDVGTELKVSSGGQWMDVDLQVAYSGK